MPARRRADRHLVHHMDKKGGQFSRIDLSQRIAMLAEPDKQVRCRATRRARPKRIAAQGFASRDQHLDKRGQCDPPFRECLLKRTQERPHGRPPTRKRQPLLAIKPVRAKSEEHTSELPSLMSISYAVSCLK